jgi:hypothetical protein
MSTDPAIIKGTNNPKRIVAMILLTVAVCLILLTAKKDSTTFVENTFVYVVSITFLVSSICFYFISTFSMKDQAQSFSFLFFAFVIVAVVTCSTYILTNNGITKFFTLKLSLNTLLIFIFLFALSIIYALFLSNTMTRGTWSSFIINFIFYIPCLLSDFFTYLLKDFITTPKSIIHLIFIEIILIITYFYLYPKLQQSTNENGVVLVSDPIMLNKHTMIDGPLYQTFSNKMNDPISDTVTIDSPLRTTFSIGMWIFLNVQSFSQLTYKKELTLFDYTSPGERDGVSKKTRNIRSHPKVAYKNNELGLDEYIFYLTPSTKTTDAIKYSKSLPHQKWNYLVFNYRDGAVDIFINGELETSVDIPTPIIYTYRDSISIGQYDLAGKDRSGIYGAICNVVYYRNILSKTQIITNYNLLSIKNPPI